MTFRRTRLVRFQYVTNKFRLLKLCVGVVEVHNFNFHFYDFIWIVGRVGLSHLFAKQKQSNLPQVRILYYPPLFISQVASWFASGFIRHEFIGSIPIPATIFKCERLFVKAFLKVKAILLVNNALS